jgi:anhydro-N-acetylmuramic acid kinase
MLKAGPVWALGAMSGTSLDGVDAALLLTDGQTISEFGGAAFRPYSAGERELLRAALGKWEGPELEAAAEVVETAHAEVLARFPEAEIVGFHGQTVAHEPRGRGTLQLGDGHVLAEVLGRPVVWDFRSADVRMGGEGAPLAPFYHHALARMMGADAPVAFLNLGGVGNITFVDPRLAAPHQTGACLAFDTGPANAPINDLMFLRRGLAQDGGGELAAAGRPDGAVLDRFLGGRWFSRMPPKSLDRDAFAFLQGEVSGLSDADAAATLTAAAAAAVARAMDFAPGPVEMLLVTGGGRHNRTLMRMISAAVACPVLPVEEAGLDGDMLEAQAFAYLAVRVARGLPTSCPGTTGVAAAIGGGEISWPARAPLPG